MYLVLYYVPYTDACVKKRQVLENKPNRFVPELAIEEKNSEMKLDNLTLFTSIFLFLLPTEGHQQVRHLFYCVSHCVYATTRALYYSTIH